MKKIITTLFALSLIAVASSSFAHCPNEEPDPDLQELFTNYDA